MIENAAMMTQEDAAIVLRVIMDSDYQRGIVLGAMLRGDAYDHSVARDRQGDRIHGQWTPAQTEEWKHENGVMGYLDAEFILRPSRRRRKLAMRFIGG